MLDVPSLVYMTTKLNFKKSVVFSVDSIPSNLRSVVYCTAIEQGGARDWQFLWQRYLSNTVVTDKAAIIAALGCSKNTRTLNK